MKETYIGMPSLTEAQRAAELLRRGQIVSTVTRMPFLPGISCAYGLRLGKNSVSAALAVLRGRGVRIGHILVREADGTLRERKP